MSNTSGRIAISDNLVEKLALASKVYSKHRADGMKFPLHALTSYNWAEVNPMIDKAMAKHKEAEDLKGKMEAA